MRLVVFGADGILGRSFIARSKSVFDVMAVDIKFGDSQASVWSGCDIIEVDITTDFDIESYLRPSDVVINFAAESRITQCNNNVVRSLQVNVLGAVTLMEACVRVGVQQFIQASSLYAAGSFGGFYGASKRALENYSQVYASCTSLNLSLVRIGSVFGGLDDDNSLPTRILRKVKGVDDTKIVANARLLRDYLPIEAVVEGILELVANPQFFNCQVEFVTGERTSLKKLLSTIGAISSMDVTEVVEVVDHGGSFAGQYLESPESEINIPTVQLDLPERYKNLESNLRKIYEGSPIGI